MMAAHPFQVQGSPDQLEARESTTYQSISATKTPLMLHNISSCPSPLKKEVIQ